jgi:hypothetical protein
VAIDEHLHVVEERRDLLDLVDEDRRSLGASRLKLGREGAGCALVTEPLPRILQIDPERVPCGQALQQARFSRLARPEHETDLPAGGSSTQRSLEPAFSVDIIMHGRRQFLHFYAKFVNAMLRVDPGIANELRRPPGIDATEALRKLRQFGR